jgi:hypothetical protein
VRICRLIRQFVPVNRFLTEYPGNASKDLRVKRITPRHLQLAIRGDEELDTLVRATIAGGGKFSFRSAVLLFLNLFRCSALHSQESDDGTKGQEVAAGRSAMMFKPLHSVTCCISVYRVAVRILLNITFTSCSVFSMKLYVHETTTSVRVT